MEKIKLVFPTMEYEKQAKEFINEANKYDKDNLSIFAGYLHMHEYEDYSKWIEMIKRECEEKTFEKGMVPSIVYFSVRESDNRIIGIINIRYYLNEYLNNYRGHIGYSIRYTERRKGYGHEQLSLALEKCKELFISRVLVTCRDNNIASAKTIESCKGVLENIVYDKDRNIYQKRYWIDIKENNE